MLKNYALAWFLILMALSWVSRTAAESSKLEPALSSAVEATVTAMDVGVAIEPQTTAPSSEEPLVLPGVVIEKIPKGSVLEKAGLQAGDVILSWERLPNPPTNPKAASGKIKGPFDWTWLEIEQAPRGMVRLTGERSGASLYCDIESGKWAADVMPNFTPLPASWLHRGNVLEEEGEFNLAIREWRSLVSWLSQRTHASEEEVWLSLRIGRALAGRGDHEEAKSYYLRAVEKAGGDLARSLVFDLIARFFFDSGESGEAERYFRSALELRINKQLGELGTASNMNSIATALYYQGRKDELDGYLKIAYKTYDRLAPQAPELIRILRNLGVRARELGDLDQSLRYHQRSVSLAETVWPNSTAHADSLHDLGVVERDSGLLGEARSHLSQALYLREHLEPGSSRLANTLNALGLLYRAQGDLDQALVMFRRSVSIAEGLAGAEGHIAAALNSIALIENALGQWPEAEADLARALNLSSKAKQAKQLVPVLLANMAMIQEKQGDFTSALALYRKALDFKKQNNRAIDIAPTLRSLGILYYRMGD